MKDVQQSYGNSESKHCLAEKLRATPRKRRCPGQKIEHGEATIDQRVQQRQSWKGRGRRGKVTEGTCLGAGKPE